MFPHALHIYCENVLQILRTLFNDEKIQIQTKKSIMIYLIIIMIIYIKSEPIWNINKFTL